MHNLFLYQVLSVATPSSAPLSANLDEAEYEWSLVPLASPFKLSAWAPFLRFWNNGIDTAIFLYKMATCMPEL